MKFLLRKLIRTVLKNWQQFFSVLLMAFLSVLFYTGLEGTWNGMQQSINQYTRESNLADSWVQTTGITNHEFQQIKRLPSVKSVSKTTEISVKAKVDHQVRYVNLSTANASGISKPNLNGNKINQYANGVYLNKEFAQSNHLKKGDFLTFHYQNRKVKLRVVNVMQSPEKMYYTGSADFLSPQRRNYGYGIISQKSLNEKFRYLGPATNLALKNHQTKNTERQIRRILGSKFITLSTRESDPEIATAIDRVTQIRNLSILFSAIFILLSILAMYTTIKRLIDSQQSDIAALRALGYSNRTLTLYYSLYGLVIGVIGTVFGWLMAPILSNFVLKSQEKMFSLPNWQISYTTNSLFVAALVMTICGFSAMLASRSQQHLSPAEALKGNSSRKSKKIFLESWQRLWHKLPIGNRWAWRDSLGNPVRMLMGIVGVVGGLALIMTGFGTKDSMTHQVNENFGHEFTYTRQLDLNSQNSARTNQRLIQQTHGQALSTLSAAVLPRGRFDRPLTIVGKGKFVHLKTLSHHKIQNGGIYVTQGIAKTAHIKVGDRLQIKPSLTTKSVEFKVKGILKSSATQGLYLTRRTWENRHFKFIPNKILIGKTNHLKSLMTDSAISKIVSMKAQRINAQRMVENLNSIFLLIQTFGILLAVIILYNLGSLSFTERSRNYATFRILGFQRSEIRSLTTSENVAITILGWCLGVPFGFWFLAKYITTFSTNQIIYYPVLSMPNLLIATLITVVSSLSAVLLVGRRLKELNMIAATKGVE